MPDIAKTRAEQCPEEEGALLCHLLAGHDGPHYDDIDLITWQRGAPDA